MLTYKTDEELEALMRSFLRKIGLEFQVKPDLMTIFVKIKQIFGDFNYRRVPDSQMQDAEAQWDSDRKVLTVRESVFCAMQRGETRARMTVAHELSHYILRHKGVLNRSINTTLAERFVRTIRHQEREARRCGAILLAPEHLVPDDIGAEGIAKHFGLSADAALYRKEEIDRLRRRARGEPRPLPPKAIDYLREAKRRGVQLRTELDD